MIEKVNPSHPDKVADRIAGCIVDYVYETSEHPNPRVAVEALIGHGSAYIIAETTVHIPSKVIHHIVKRISGIESVVYNEVPQDPELSKNQDDKIRAGDNGIFRGVPVSKEVAEMSEIAQRIYKQFPTDGKYILAGNRLIVCQSNGTNEELTNYIKELGDYELVLNPLGEWTGGLDVDTGAVNRKLGSDMGDAVTGGGLHGKDLSKADVAVNIYAHLMAQETGEVVELHCAIGDEFINGVSYAEITKVAADYVSAVGGFENLAEWGLV